MSCALYIKTKMKTQALRAFVYMVWLKRILKMKIFSNVCGQPYSISAVYWLLHESRQKILAS